MNTIIGRLVRSDTVANVDLLELARVAAAAFNVAMLCLSGFGVQTPILAAAGHNLGSVAVVLNSARLLRFKVWPCLSLRRRATTG